MPEPIPVIVVGAGSAGLAAPFDDVFTAMRRWRRD
jgi:hypothetical protein